MKVLSSLTIILLLVASVPGAQALPGTEPQSPTDLEGRYDGATGELTLTWLPPENDTTAAFVYQVYQDGVLLADTTETNLTTSLDLGGHVFWVTATNEQGEESLPSQPVYAQHTQGTYPGDGELPSFEPAGGNRDDDCQAINLIVDDSQPFADVVVREDCLPPLPCQDQVTIPVKWKC